MQRTRNNYKGDSCFAFLLPRVGRMARTELQHFLSCNKYSGVCDDAVWATEPTGDWFYYQVRRKLFQFLPGQKWAYCLTTFLELQISFLVFCARCARDSTCFLWWDVGLLLFLWILKYPSQGRGEAFTCLSVYHIAVQQWGLWGKWMGGVTLNSSPGKEAES